MTFTAEVLDTWQMTTTAVPGTFTLKQLDDTSTRRQRTFNYATRRPYMAIRLTRTGQ
jgi:hypothetical protein